jgi:hypothetical protein
VKVQSHQIWAFFGNKLNAMIPLVLLLVLMLGFTTSCSGQNPLEALEDPQSNIAESSTAAVGSIATDSEGGSMSAASYNSKSLSSPIHPASNQTMGVCSYTAARNACVGSAMTVTWDNCEMSTASGINLMLSNGWTNTYDSAATCTSAQGGGSLTAAGQSLTRTSSSFIITLLAGATVTTDTNAQTTAYLNQAIPGTGVTLAVGASSKTITINGVHQVLHGPEGRVWFDHSLTSGPMTVTGTRAGGNRVINGQVTIYHNTEMYKAVSTFNNVTWGNPTCCFPTGGTLTSVFSGAVAGTSTMTYTATCGTATFTNTSGTTSSVSLSICE